MTGYAHHSSLRRAFHSTMRIHKASLLIGLLCFAVSHLDALTPGPTIVIDPGHPSEVSSGGTQRSWELSAVGDVRRWGLSALE